MGTHTSPLLEHPKQRQLLASTVTSASSRAAQFVPSLLTAHALDSLEPGYTLRYHAKYKGLNIPSKELHAFSFCRISRVHSTHMVVVPLEIFAPTSDKTS